MTPDYIEEGWVRFRRVPCKEGHIDVWMGDSGSNPNDEERPYYNLNSFATYLRCNGSKWVHSRDLKHNGHYLPYLDMASEFTAEEIWSELNKTKSE